MTEQSDVVGELGDSVATDCSAYSDIVKSLGVYLHNFSNCNSSQIFFQGRGYKLTYFKLLFFCVSPHQLTSQYKFLQIANRSQFYRAIPIRKIMGYFTKGFTIGKIAGLTGLHRKLTEKGVAID